MKIIRKLLIGFLITALSLCVTVFGAYIFIRNTFGIDIFRTFGQLKTLSEPVNETELCPNSYTDDDFISLETTANAEIDGFIKVEEGTGYNGYSLDFNALHSASFTKGISLSEKQVGALTQIIFFEVTGGKIDLGIKEVNAAIIQTEFSEIAEDGSADFNVVCKLDLSPFKADMDKFPYSLFKKYIPDCLYISSAVRIGKTGDGGFDYTLSHKGLTLNNLNAKETDDLFRTLDTLLNIGSAESVNMQIGSTVVNVLIGNEENVGFAYSLKAVGATQFNFENVISDETSVELFTVK